MLRSMKKTRPWAGLENSALMSCELGGKSSREAAGIHYYLRQARNGPQQEV